MPLVAVDLPPLNGHPSTELTVDARYDAAGATLVSRSIDGLRVWDVGDGKQRRRIPGSFSEMALVSGTEVLAGTKDRAIAFDLRTGRETASYATGWDWVEGLAASTREVVIRDDSESGVQRYDRSGRRLEVPDGLARGHGPLVLSPSGVLYWVDRLDHLTAWDPGSGETWIDDRPGLVARLDFDPVGGWVAATVWDWPRARSASDATWGWSGRSTGAAAPDFAQPWDYGWVRVTGPTGERVEIPRTGYDAAIAPMGAFVAIAHGSFVEIRTLPDGEPALVLDARGTVGSVDVSVEGEVAAFTTAGPIRRWAIQDDR